MSHSYRSGLEKYRASGALLVSRQGINLTGDFEAVYSLRETLVWATLCPANALRAYYGVGSGLQPQ